MKGDKFYMKHESIDGVTDWLWIEGETGLWLGPMQNWNDSHKAKIQKWCKGFGLVVQAGGGGGMYPRLLSNMFKSVYTFEPEPSNFQCLVHNVRHRDVWCFNAALGEEVGWCSVHEGSKQNRGTHRVQKDNMNRVPMMTIDSFKFTGVDLIMLDVEGYEGKILEGAVNTINRCKPIIIAEGGKSRCRDIIPKLGYEAVDQSVSDTFFKHKDT